MARSFLLWAAAVLLALGCGGGDGSGEDGGPPAFAPQPTVAEPPADPLAGSGVASCPIYQQQRCVDGRLQRCAVYDTASGEFVDQPDSLLDRVYLYDRWYDLYASPAGLTAERVFTGPMPGATPEAEWGDAAVFDRWAGCGDAAIWTGAALVADAFRYVATGTRADYRRMEDKTRALLRNFQVTGIPGYLARYHYLRYPERGPNSDQLIVRWGEPGATRDLPIAEADLVAGLPEAYTAGLPDEQGQLVQGTPMWNGHPSIDQYTGPMMAFPIVYDLLADEQLKAAIVEALTCYLKRLRRMEIINLQDNPEVLAEISDYFAGADIQLDPGDPDLMQLDRLVWYVHLGINPANRDGFDRSCPEQVQLEPYRVIDAASDAFMTDMLDLAADLSEPEQPVPGQIDHFYIVSLRGGDASHLMHLATIAYYLTGEEQYRSFLFDELIGELDAPAVADTMMAFRQPDYCFKYYGDHITYGTHWQFVTMLPDGELRQRMIAVMEEEIWRKALYDHKSAKFNAMYAGVVPAAVASERQRAIDELVAQLHDFGGNDGVQNAPRRTHDVSRQQVLDQLPAGTEVRCPTADERQTCEEPVTLFGIPLEHRDISYACDGRAAECEFGDGQCAEGLASEGLPASLRRYADYMWQRSPFGIGDPRPVDGQVQSPGRDLSEPYWLARFYGFIDEGQGQVLAWREVGGCP